MDKSNTPSNSVGVALAPELPAWLSSVEETPTPSPLAVSRDSKAAIILQFEAVFPRILDMMSGGSTFAAAVRDLPIELDTGAFMRWIKRDPQRHEAYKEAQEICTEAWAGKALEYAEGADSLEDVQRSKLKVDTLKWLISSYNRRRYGDVKQVELGGQISISAALAAAQNRVITDEVIDVPLLSNDEDN